MHFYTRANSPFIWLSETIDGGRFRISTKCTTEREARRVAPQLIAEERQRRASVRTHGDAWRLRDLLGSYWDDVGKAKKSEAGIFGYFAALTDIIGPDVLVEDINTATLLDYRARRRAQNGCSAVTVNRDFAMLRAALNHAADAYAKPLPHIAWKRVMVAENPYRIRFASAEEFARLLTAAHPSIRPIIIMAVTTGLRRANILQLAWHQVDMDGGTITVPATKSGKPHMVKMAGALRGALASIQPDAAARSGKVFDLTNWRKRWQAARETADVADIRFHDLRHTFASWARRAGADLPDIKEALAHSSINVTMRYAHVTPDQTTTAFDRVAALLTPEHVAHSESHTPAKQRKSAK